MRKFSIWHKALICCLLGFAAITAEPDAVGAEPSPPKVRLREWGKGIAIDSLLREGMSVYLWFYEWNMFEARSKGQHTRGAHDWNRVVSTGGQSAAINTGDMKLTMQAVEDGAELTLEITNRTDYAWPEIAGIIPCFNPGVPADRAAQYPEATINPEFDNQNTWFVGRGGLRKLRGRDIHFNFQLRKQVDLEAIDGKYVFSYKWPTSSENAYAGLILRESNDSHWIAGIAWERFLSAQGHNPWSCMHLGIQVGPLKPQESRTVHGFIYLFPGTRNDCHDRFRRDFNR
jgi:hypothetical protein